MPIKIEQPATFSVVAADIATDNNKSMFSLYNGSGGPSLVKIHEIWIQNTKTTAVTGVIMSLDLRRITGHTGGTNLTIGRYDTTQSPASSIDAKTNASVSGESAVLLDKWVTTNDEWAPGTLDLEGFSAILSHHFPAWASNERTRPIILRDGEGITIKCATNTTVGSFDIVVVFTQE
jgi:hypothetical protein